MRIKSKFQVSSFLIVAMFLCLTSIGYAQRSGMIQHNANGMSQVRMDAQREAQADVNQLLWGTGSCLLASAFMYLREPNVLPNTR